MTVHVQQIVLWIWFFIYKDSAGHSSLVSEQLIPHRLSTYVQIDVEKSMTHKKKIKIMKQEKKIIHLKL